MVVRQDFNAGIGAAIKAAREDSNMTQDQLASAVRLSRTSISNIEVGRQKMLLDDFCDIALALHLEPSVLLARATSHEAPAAAHDIEGLKLKAKGSGLTREITHEDIEAMVNNVNKRHGGSANAN